MKNASSLSTMDDATKLEMILSLPIVITIIKLIQSQHREHPSMTCCSCPKTTRVSQPALRININARRLWLKWQKLKRKATSSALSAMITMCWIIFSAKAAWIRWKVAQLAKSWINVSPAVLATQSIRTRNATNAWRTAWHAKKTKIVSRSRYAQNVK